MERPAYDAVLIYKGFYNQESPGSTPACSAMFVDHLVKTLENQGLRIYYADRDAIPGNNIFNEAFQVLDRSKYVICVFTEDFLENSWGIYWQQSAFRKLIESSRTGSTFFIPLALGIGVDTVRLHCPCLNITEILEVPVDYQINQTWLCRLLTHMDVSQQYRGQSSVDGFNETGDTSGQRQNDLFTVNRDILTMSLEVIPVMDYMTTGRLITTDDIQQVNRVPGHGARVVKLLDVLHNKGDEGVRVLLHTLQIIQPPLYAALQGKPGMASEARSRLTKSPEDDAMSRLSNQQLIDEILDDTFLYHMASNLGPEWLELGSHLGIAYSELRAVQQNYPNNHLQQVFSILSVWRDRVRSRPLSEVVEQLTVALQASLNWDLMELVALRTKEFSRPVQAQSSRVQRPPAHTVCHSASTGLMSLCHGAASIVRPSATIQDGNRGNHSGVTNHDNRFSGHRNAQFSNAPGINHGNAGGSGSNNHHGDAGGSGSNNLHGNAGGSGSNNLHGNTGGSGSNNHHGDAGGSGSNNLHGNAGGSGSNNHHGNTSSSSGPAKASVLDNQSYRKMLVRLDEDLEKDNIWSMKLLCQDKIPLVRLEPIQRGIDMFRELEDQGILDLHDYDILAELLYHIKRIDLLRCLPDFSKSRVESTIRENGSSFSAFRLLLHGLTEEIMKDELEAIRCYLLGRVTQNRVDGIHNTQTLFMVLQQVNLLKPNNVGYLKELFQDVDMLSLLDRVCLYESIEVGTSGHPTSPPPRLAGAVGMVRPPTLAGAVGMVTSPRPAGFVLPPVKDAHSPGPGPFVADPLGQSPDELPCYRMTHRPRGVCIIINNVNFFQIKNDPSSRAMPNRTGSDVDRDRLVYIFDKLEFHVQPYVFNNLTADQMQQRLVDIAFNVDHSQYDCMVCCILTHGASGRLYGTDGKLIEIKEITNYFKGGICQTLRGKPKLFFIQACQGKEKQPAVPLGLEADGAPRLPEPSSGYEVLEQETIPNEADFVLGYATVPGYVSYRSKTAGSWYMTALVNSLEKYSHSYDLMSILVKVNQDVAGATAKLNGGAFKQIPAPLVTLRKRIFFS